VILTEIIKIKELKKTYISYERGSTFLDAVKSLFARKSIKIEALKGITLNINKGELLGFLGPNGAGKSTTLKILTGVLHPTSGEVNIMGFTPWRQRKAYVSNIGAVFGQKSQLIWDIPPMDSFEMNRAIYGIPSSEYKSRLYEMLDMLNLKDIVHKPTRQLSLGERMKCEFIMAMLHNPSIVFLDEPTIGLDVIAKEIIRDFIREQNKKGVTFVLTTHDLGDVEQLAGRVVVINYGEIVFDNTLDALRKLSGVKKKVNLATKKAIPALTDIPGIRLTARTSPYICEFELDMEMIDLNRFIHIINEKCIISDLTISEPPIENVIKELYTKKSKPAESPIIAGK
jgi:ABC-2 type transport system ATP-binding protein